MQYLVICSQSPKYGFLCGVNVQLENPEPNTVKGNDWEAGIVNLLECLPSMHKALGSSRVSQKK